ncbi:hypothetical protein GBA52_005038 [Prunus armeniaca]|nr:hypothetical protein GBA52_005038 [Prunus armeniaca]
MASTTTTTTTLITIATATAPTNPHHRCHHQHPCPTNTTLQCYQILLVHSAWLQRLLGWSKWRSQQNGTNICPIGQLAKLKRQSPSTLHMTKLISIWHIGMHNMTLESAPHHIMCKCNKSKIMSTFLISHLQFGHPQGNLTLTRTVPDAPLHKPHTTANMTRPFLSK